MRTIIADAWQPLTDELHTSRLGSLHGLRRGRQEGDRRQSVLIATHMDAIGLIVSGLMDGFLRVTQVGGLDPRVLPGQLVTVHARQDLPGIIILPPTHLLPEAERETPVALQNLLIDTGLHQREVERLVRVGDLVSFAQPPIEINDEYLAGHTLDNRASVAALTYCLQELQGRQIKWDLWAAATVQEEESLAGAFTSAFDLRPTLAIAVDVTFASSPGSPAHKTFPLGKGIALGWGPNIHPKLYKIFQELAERLEIPNKIDPMSRMSGTDAMALQVVADGIPTMVIGIPLRYMHTPVEMISMKDIQRAGRLLAEFVVQLDENFMEKLSLEK